MDDRRNEYDSEDDSLGPASEIRQAGSAEGSGDDDSFDVNIQPDVSALRMFRRGSG